MSRKRRRPPRAVIDTSVVIAGAAAFRGSPLFPKTSSGKLLLRWIEEGHFQWLYSEEILDEYKEVLRRCGVRAVVIGTFINLLREEGVPIFPRSTASLSPDPDDDPFCACAESADADCIVTLNPRDFPQKHLRARVISPDQPLSKRKK